MSPEALRELEDKAAEVLRRAQVNGMADAEQALYWEGQYDGVIRFCTRIGLDRARLVERVRGEG